MFMSLTEPNLALERMNVADYLRHYCCIHPRSEIGMEIGELSIEELVAVFYLVAYECVPIPYAMLRCHLVAVERLPPRLSKHDSIGGIDLFQEALMCWQQSTTTFCKQQVVAIRGQEWRVTDRR
jgi:hypothetical protein